MPVVIGALREIAPNETRVALVPEVAGKLNALGARVVMEGGAGAAAQFPDAAYSKVELAESAQSLLGSVDVLLKVQAPSVEETSALRKGATVIAFLQPHQRIAEVRALRDRGITSFAMELVPRISRAQSMDALSSQAAIAGYKSVLIGASTLDKFFPMLTTAAGTIRPAQVLVIGAGVAGLQAIATRPSPGSGR